MLPRVLMMLSSHDTLGESGRPTGLGLEEAATPLRVFRSGGVACDLASVRGGRPPIDPGSEAPGAAPEDLDHAAFEEAAVGVTTSIPFSLERRPVGLGATVDVGAPFGPHTHRDGNLITGQNPASSREVADRVVAAAEVRL